MRGTAVLLAALLVGSTVAVVPAAAVEGATVDHEGDALSLSAGPAQQISGQTDLAAGTDVTVRVALDDTSTPLLRQQTATVGDDGRFAVTVDLHRAAPESSGNVTVLADGEQLARTRLRITPCDGDCEPVTTEPSAGNSPFNFDGEAITLSAAPDQEISGQTDLAAGTDVAVRLQSTSGESPFLLRETSTVDENGNFTVSMDLSGVPPNVTAAATLRADGETVDEQAVTVEGEAGESATATPPAEDSPFDFDGEAITLSAAPDQEISGQTDLAAGTDVAVRLQSTGGGSPFLQRPTTTVDEDGRFSVQVNLSGVEPGDAVATLRADGETVAERAVHVESTGSDGTGPGTNDQPTTDGEQSNDDTDRDASSGESTVSDDSDTTTDAAGDRNDDATDTSGDSNRLSDAGLVGGSAVGILTLFGVGARLLN